jgi:hypothetical protein
MRTVSLGILAVGALFTGLACSSSKSDTTSVQDAGNDGEVVDGGGGDAPDGCDPAADPKDSPACVVDAYGVFVDSTGGNDANAGTQALPVKTIGAALGKLGAKPRVYICEGTYPEQVKLASAVSLYGGFACGPWTYSGTKPTVAPTAVGYALEIADTTSDVVIGDLSFVAANAVDKGQSSIAAFVHGASKVTILRGELHAGDAKDGANGETGVPGTITAVKDDVVLNASGYPASGTTAGKVKICTCSSGGTTSGAGGGAPGGMGAPGTPNLGGAAPTDGVGGLGNTSCAAAEPNGTGNIGLFLGSRAAASWLTRPDRAAWAA